jgi:Dolichyl-phosphate-mannose-protein mannosyltransferase
MADHQSAGMVRAGLSGHLWLLLIAALLLLISRLTLVILLEVQPWSDLRWYYERALELLERSSYSERGVPTAYWPVGYPAFLAGVMALTSPSLLAGQIANLVLSLCSMFMLYWWCLRHFDSPRVGAVAALMLSVYPNHMGYSVGLYSEPLFTVLLLALFMLSHPESGWLKVCLSGVVAGLACLTKAQSLLLAPLIVFALSLPSMTLLGARVAVLRTVAATLVMLMTISPWTYRNWSVFHALIPVSTNGGMSLLAGNNPAMSTSLMDNYSDRHPLVDSVKFSVADQSQADRRAKAAAWAWIRENPTQFLALMPKKLFRLWAVDGESEWLFQAGYKGYDENRSWFRGIRVVNQIYYLCLLVAAALAMLRWPKSLRWREPAAYPVPLMLILFSALSMVFSGQSRYHAPMMPFIMGYAAWLYIDWRDRKGRS